MRKHKLKIINGCTLAIKHNMRKISWTIRTGKHFLKHSLGIKGDFLLLDLILCKFLFIFCFPTYGIEFSCFGAEHNNFANVVIEVHAVNGKLFDENNP